MRSAAGAPSIWSITLSKAPPYFFADVFRLPESSERMPFHFSDSFSMRSRTASTSDRWPLSPSIFIAASARCSRGKRSRFAACHGSRCVFVDRSQWDHLAALGETELRRALADGPLQVGIG